ncbi:hypothetical protein CC78DRAFT_59869 [Lojkania enalia]|uniref:Uncharacterized protein n=1 Tax=Lojkania enalia TaxID=147567 RepID=A0A9P4N905_9PLEO|nr:hypothetical protein CC78DRAFT_59869 [Didymosphaeria enalia]
MWKKYSRYLLGWDYLVLVCEIVFANPFTVFGPRASHLAIEWSEPNVEPSTELWRCTTVIHLMRRAGLMNNQSEGIDSNRPLHEVLLKSLSLSERPNREASYGARDGIHSARPTFIEAFRGILRNIVLPGEYQTKIENVVIAA